MANQVFVQRVLILTDRQMVEPISPVINVRCHQPWHATIDSLHKTRVSNRQAIILEFERCPDIKTLVIDFTPVFALIHQGWLATTLAQYFPLLEHLEWTAQGPKRAFLREFAHYNFANLACWKVAVDDTESQEVLMVFTKSPILRPISLSVGRHVGQVLSRIDPARLESLEITTYLVGEEDEPFNISQCTALRKLKCSIMTAQNYVQLARLTTLRSIQIDDTDGILNVDQLVDILINQLQLVSLTVRLHDGFRAVQAIGTYGLHFGNLSFMKLKIEAPPNFLNANDWLSLSMFQRLRSLSLGGISTTPPYRAGIQSVILNCANLYHLCLEHLQDLENVALDDLMDTQASIRGIVEEAELQLLTYSFDIVLDSPIEACKLEWVRRDH